MVTSRQKSRLITGLVVLFGLATAYCFLAALDVLVSLKYETDGPNECISTITGHDLCLRLTIYKVAAPVCLFLALALAVAKDALLGKAEK
ncbi:hypothetical protein [Hymenobacter lucidus]|uniref:Uncharacterized protein n=1 Tax=Hymenobacter lucidus TaxID=2880930 RepID=A0ABS8AXL8_9BACT|nr:hypothetical protein [Hymenobacter lucidus]MCB2410557.1 hypothetical protein [Hymenobacter lucidus]